MKVKIKLDREELKGFETILEILRDNLHGGEVTDTIYQEELRAFEMKMMQKLITPSKSYSVALPNMITAILYERYDPIDFMPFERALYSRILEAIDKAHTSHLHMMMNFKNDSGAHELSANNQKMLQ